MEKIKVNYEKTVSFDIDAQNGFTPNCPDELPVVDGDKIVDECNKNATKAKYRYMSKDAHSSSGIYNATTNDPQFSPVVGEKNVDMKWNQHCNVGTFGFELIEGLPRPNEYNFIIYKGVEVDMHPYSPIYHDLSKNISTGIIEKAINDGIDTFILGGLALDYCLGIGAFDLKEAGFNVIVNLSATKSIGDAETYIKKLKSAGIICVETADDIESQKSIFYL